MSTKIDWSYWAGFFDGEGCVTCYNNGGRQSALRVYLSCCNKEVIEKFCQLFKGSSFEEQRYKNQHRNCWRSRINGESALFFLKGILPYTIVKKEEIKVAIEFPIGRPGIKVPLEMAERRNMIDKELRRLKRADLILGGGSLVN